MPEPHGLILGFDPGGEGRRSQGEFGWSICKTINGTLQPPIETGLAKNARDALHKVKDALKHHRDGDLPVVAAGIDAPLFWNPQGKRTVDTYLKKVLKPFGMDNSVNQINSLRGACLAQGLLIGRHLQENWDIPTPMTEAHPTVLLHLLKHMGQPESIRMTGHVIDGLAGHQRDATLSAVAAWAMLHQPPDWHDLYVMEPCPVELLDQPISYWMPIS